MEENLENGVSRGEKREHFKEQGLAHGVLWEAKWNEATVVCPGSGQVEVVGALQRAVVVGCRR